MKSVVAAFAPFFLLSGCATTGGAAAEEASVQRSVIVREPAIKTTYRGEAQAGLTPEEEALLADHCVGGEPRLVATSFGETVLIVREGYALRHSSTKKIPLFVCEHIEAAELGTGERPGSWAIDPVLKAKKLPTAKNTDYTNSGWSRGHMAPNADYKDDARKKETFYFSNAVPQEQKMNGGLWSSLEARARQWAQSSSTGVWVVTGPLFWEAEEDDPATADGHIEHEAIGDNLVAVPTHIYKVVIRKKNGGHEMLAFVAVNDVPESDNFEDWVVPVDWLEERVGLDFAPDLPLDAEEAAQPSLWP